MALAIVSVSAMAQINVAITDHFSPIPSATKKAWDNPALLDMKYASSLTDISGLYYNSNDERFGSFAARTYLKLKSVTIAGNAGYENGAKHNVRFCENVDIPTVYPYLTYDAIGGNLNLERYYFGGSIDVPLGKNWDVGASLSYKAGLFYRNIDPRPKDITSEFTISGGGAYSLNQSYKIALQADYMKYKQSCDITFMSELGEAKIYHMTGLGTHYSRFAGQGHDSYYNGHRYGGSATLMPANSGLHVDAEGHIEKVTYILSDLNNLPMARIDSRSLNAEVGYKTQDWGITGYTNILRRHGYENIFGDASTGQYPLIATLGMHLVNMTEAGIRTVASFHLNETVLSIMPQINWSHYSEAYREPSRSLLLDNLSAGSDIRVIMPIGKKFLLRGDVGYRIIPSLKSELKNVVTDSEDLNPFFDILTENFNVAASTRSSASVNIGGDFMFSKNRYALALDIYYSYLKGRNDISCFSLSFKF